MYAFSIVHKADILLILTLGHVYQNVQMFQ